MSLHSWPLATIRVTDQGLKDYGDGTRQAGTASLWRIKIHPDFADDAGLLAHELEHVAQFWRGGFLVALVLIAAATIFAAELGALRLTLLGAAPGAVLAAHPALYTWVPRYRLWAELLAYHIQAQVRAADGKDRLPLFAGFIADRYGLDITAAEAERRLRQG